MLRFRVGLEECGEMPSEGPAEDQERERLAQRPIDAFV